MEDTYKEWRAPGRGKDVPKDCTSRHSLSVASKTLIDLSKKVWENEFSHPFVLKSAIPFINAKNSGGDALRGNTRSHLEHEG